MIAFGSVHRQALGRGNTIEGGGCHGSGGEGQDAGDLDFGGEIIIMKQLQPQTPWTEWILILLDGGRELEGHCLRYGSTPYLGSRLGSNSTWGAVSTVVSPFLCENAATRTMIAPSDR